MQRAFHNSPLLPEHKPYIVYNWNGAFWLEHCVPEGLTLAMGKQGKFADAMLDLLHIAFINFAVKWVDDFTFF